MSKHKGIYCTKCDGFFPIKEVTLVRLNVSEFAWYCPTCLEIFQSQKVK